MNVVLTLLPIVAIFILLVFRNLPADTSGLVGWMVALAIAVLFFTLRFRLD